jgi:methanogenic corrinoid protein MtbC1
MFALNSECGDRLRSAASLIAEGTLARTYAERPSVFESYGDKGRAKCRQDIRCNVAALAAAVDADDAGIFVRYVAWLKVLLVSRGIASDAIEENLRCMASALMDDASGDHSIAASYVYAALEEIDAMPSAVASFIEPSNQEHAVAQRCLEALLRLDAGAGREILEKAIAAGMPLMRIYTGIIPPLMHEIGRLWQMNEITVAHEHYCSAAVQSMLGAFNKSIYAAGSSCGRSMMIACVEGDRHELGARTVADVFQLNGWRTSFLGATLPPHELAKLIRQTWRPPDLIALSATIPAHLPQLEATIAVIRDGSNIPIMVGGYLFCENRGLAVRLGADGCADDAEAALSLANALVPHPA